MYVDFIFKINSTSILFKIIYFKYSKFAKIAKIKILNWPRFSGYYNLPHLKLFVPEKEQSRKWFDYSTLRSIWIPFSNSLVSENFQNFKNLANTLNF